MSNDYCLKIVKIFLILILMTFSPINISAQKFWLTTFSFPGGPKTSITLGGDSCLVVGLTDKVMQSCDDGFSWNFTLNTDAIYCLASAGAGRLIAGGTGKIFYSDNTGESWDSIAINSIYPVTDITRDVDNKLILITAGITHTGNYTGDGVFASEDNGINWEKRNNGLGTNPYCDQIASDANGRLYLAIPDPDLTGSKGLFISDDSGLSWQHINISIDGQGIIADEITINYTTGLSVSPDDSVYLSLFGSAVNVGVTLNIHKSINDITSNNFWKVDKVANVNHWWNDHPLNDIHFAANGDWYSSISGSLITGGTFFSANQGQRWDQHQEGLGLDKFGSFSNQLFAENESGKIYMVQLYDEQIYWADTSMTLAVTELQNNADNNFIIFPDPVKSLGDVQISRHDSGGIMHMVIRDISGKIILQKELEYPLTFKAPEKPGIYLVNIRDRDLSRNFKVIVF